MSTTTSPPLAAALGHHVAIVPKAPLLHLLTLAREVAEMHEASKQPADYIEVRLLRAVEDLEGLMR